MCIYYIISVLHNSGRGFSTYGWWASSTSMFTFLGMPIDTKIWHQMDCWVNFYILIHLIKFTPISTTSQVVLECPIMHLCSLLSDIGYICVESKNFLIQCTLHANEICHYMKDVIKGQLYTHTEFFLYTKIVFQYPFAVHSS